MLKNDNAVYGDRKNITGNAAGIEGDVTGIRSRVRRPRDVRQVAVFVRGGLVQSVVVSDPDVQVMLVDYDVRDDAAVRVPPDGGEAFVADTTVVVSRKRIAELFALPRSK